MARILSPGLRRRWIRPHHTRWLVAWLLALLIAMWAGAATLAMAGVFVVVFAVGAALISLDSPPPDDEPADSPEIRPNGE